MLRASSSTNRHTASSRYTFPASCFSWVLYSAAKATKIVNPRDRRTDEIMPLWDVEKPEVSSFKARFRFWNNSKRKKIPQSQLLVHVFFFLGNEQLRILKVLERVSKGFVGNTPLGFTQLPRISKTRGSYCYAPAVSLFRSRNQVDECWYTLADGTDNHNLSMSMYAACFTVTPPEYDVPKSGAFVRRCTH